MGLKSVNVLEPLNTWYRLSYGSIRSDESQLQCKDSGRIREAGRTFMQSRRALARPHPEVDRIRFLAFASQQPIISIISPIHPSVQVLGTHPASA